MPILRPMLVTIVQGPDRRSSGMLKPEQILRRRLHPV